MQGNNIEDIYPLAPLQQGMLFHTLHSPSSGVGIQQARYTLSGELHRQAFRDAWQQVIDRHAVLRTFFMWEEVDEPLQVVCGHVEIPWLEYDWQACSVSEQQQRLDLYVKEDRVRGFDLQQAPLMRLALVRLAEDRHELLWTFHHLLFDGWSAPLLLDEVFTFYEATLNAQKVILPAPKPYRDYIAWLQRQDLSQAEQFWRKELQGFITPTLPGASMLRAEAGEKEASYKSEECWLDEQYTTSLEALARRHGLTLNTIVQGAWALLLSHYSGQEDVLFGCTVSGRPPEISGIEAMVGMFINTLPVRVRISQHASLMPWLQTIQAQQIRTRQFEYSPLVQVQGWSEIPRGQSLFESLVVFENYPVKNSQGLSHPLTISDSQAIVQNNYPLTLIVVPGSRLLLHLGYQEQRLETVAILRILSHLRTLLEQIATNSARSLIDLPLLTSHEQQQLAQWNATEETYEPFLSLPQLIAAQVERIPDAIAALDNEQQITYGVLERQAERLASYLQNQGIGPGDLVGVYMQRSVDVLIGLLGIMKTGAAYLPLEPQHPQEHLQFILKDAHISLVLTHRDYTKRLPDCEGLRVISLDTEDTKRSLIVCQPQQRSSRTLQPGYPAYVIYTSGSTGRPKGVVVTQAGLLNYLHWGSRHYRGAPGQGAIIHSSLGFDTTITSLFIPLLWGQRVIMVAETVGGEALIQMIRQMSPLSFLKLTPSHLALTNRALSPLEMARATHVLIVGGEVLPAEHLAPWRRAAPSLRIFNSYGPTETTVACSSYTIAEQDPATGPLSIGRPIANAQIYVLDRYLRPLPAGLPGEIYIGGAGLSQGYLHRPEMTAERFVPNPFSVVAGARLYKTGDIAAFQPDGYLVFMGRQDDQVKFQGYRIEMGEIEAALRLYPGVQDACVLLREDDPGDKRLVGYVSADDQQLSMAALRSFLQDQLPAYMLPSTIIALASLPLTVNGKINRRMLPVPQQTRTEFTTTFIHPRDIVECQLVVLWEELLKVRPISITDDFFTLGGHSLLAICMVARLQKLFGLAPSLAAFMEEPTIQDLARLLREENVGNNASSLVTIRSQGTKTPLFCVHPASGTVFCYFHLAPYLDQDQPLYALQDPDIHEEEYPDLSVEQMAARYIEAILSVQPEGPYRLSGYSFGGVVAFEIAQQLKKQGQEVELLVNFDGGAPSLARTHSLQDEARFLAIITLEMTRNALNKNYEEIYRDLQDLTLPEQLTYALEHLQQAGITVPGEGKQWVAQQLRIFQSRTRALQRYTPQLYHGEMILLKSDDHDQDIPEDRGWGELVSQPLHIHIVANYHDTLFLEPGVHTLANHLNLLLNAGNPQVVASA
jgi:surfactin family lipopeptide synthetase C